MQAKTIELDESGTPVLQKGDARNVAGCSLTAAAVVQLQDRLPNARVVYCSATSVSDPKNLGFMSRLGLWGPGTQHPSGFNQFLKALEDLGTGAMELHALHLKATGVLLARTLSYSSCEFNLVNNVMNKDISFLYDEAANLWKDLNIALENDMQKRNERIEKLAEIDRRIKEGALIDGDMKEYLNENADSDDEGDMSEAEALAAEYRRKCRNRKPRVVKALFWVSLLDRLYSFALVISILLFPLTDYFFLSPHKRLIQIVGRPPEILPLTLHRFKSRPCDSRNQECFVRRDVRCYWAAVYRRGTG